MDPQVRTVRLGVDFEARVDAVLATGRTGLLVLRFELLELDPTGRALVWFHHPVPRLAALQLDFETTCRGLEAPLPSEVVSKWAVLGKRGDRYVVAQWDAPTVNRTRRDSASNGASRLH